jgi:SNF2 family DNA or RNA helicase
MNAKYIADSAPSTAYMKMRKAVNLWTKNGDKTAPNSAMVLLDESHAIADPSSSQSEIALSLAKFFTYRYLSTGTPADKEQKYYAQLKFMDPTLVHNFSYTDWTNEYFNKGTEFSQSDIVSIKPEKKRDLVHIVRKYCIRRFSKDCLNLPEHFVKKVYCTLSDKQKEIYSMFIALNMRKLDEEDGCIKSHKVKNLFPHLIMAIDNPLNMTGIEDAVLLSKISRFRCYWTLLKSIKNLKLLSGILTLLLEISYLVYSLKEMHFFFMEKLNLQKVLIKLRIRTK